MFNGIIYNQGTVTKIIKRPKGLNSFANLTTFLSKKYNPVIAKLEKCSFGFSLIDIILLLLFTFANPYNSGFETLCSKTFAPFLSFTQSSKV